MQYGCRRIIIQVDAAHWWWLRRSPPPFYIKRFEYPEKHYINVTNYYYYYYVCLILSPVVLYYVIVLITVFQNRTVSVHILLSDSVFRSHFVSVVHINKLCFLSAVSDCFFSHRISLQVCDSLEFGVCLHTSGCVSIRSV